MAKLKYAHCFVTADKPNLKLPAYRHPTDPKTTRRLAYIDQDTVKGAEFGSENVWLLPGGPKEQRLMDPNTEPYVRFIGFYGYQYDNIHDLCAEVEIHIGGEKHIVKKGFAAFIPEGLEVGPVIIRNITKPVFFMMAFPCGKAVKK
ncbi:MAG: hypothetical protein WC370_05915 [Dehalococcoidales bacterium]|jgi:hypothetical protein